jgi:integrase
MRTYSMTWVAKTFRWMKQYEGRYYAVSCRQLSKRYGVEVPPTQEGSRAYANRWWAERKAELDAAARPTPPATPLEGIAQALGPAALANPDQLQAFLASQVEAAAQCQADAAPAATLAELLRKIVADHVQELVLQKLVLTTEPIADQIAARLTADQLQLLRQAQTGVAGLLEHATPAAAPDRSIQGQFTAWAGRQELRYAAKEISLGAYDNKKRWCRHFVDFCGAANDVGVINDKLLDQFDEHCLRQRAAQERGAKGWTDYLVRDVRMTTREFVRWLADQEAIPRPSWLTRKSFKFRLTPREPKPWTVPEFLAVLEAANEKIRLVLLLMANTGMYQGEVAELTTKDVDWEGGYLRRRRAKTRHVKNAPVVSYKLWPTTLALLQKYRRDDGERLIRTNRGTPYVRDVMRNGTRLRADSIWAYFSKLKVKVRKQMPDFTGSPKGLRKMSSSLLDSHQIFGRYAWYFLGHAPSNVTDKHYVRPDQDQFDAAVHWLGCTLCQVPEQW